VENILILLGSLVVLECLFRILPPASVPVAAGPNHRAGIPGRPERQGSSSFSFCIRYDIISRDLGVNSIIGQGPHRRTFPGVEIGGTRGGIMRPIPFDSGVLQRRRQELGLSYELLAQRSGVSRPTVQRILSGRYPTASFASVVALGYALGLELRLASAVTPQQLKREQ